MSMEASILSALSDFSVPAISVLVIAYMLIKTNESREANAKRYVDSMDANRRDYQETTRQMRSEHESSMKEREQAFRALEKDVRERILTALIESSKTIAESAKIMERVVAHMDTHH